MSVAAPIHAPVNGFSRRPVEVNEVSEYQKILQVYNQVIGGTHPRLRLSGARSSPARDGPDQNSSIPQGQAALPLVSNLVPRTQSPSLLSRNSFQELPVKEANVDGPHRSSQPLLAKPRASELDPIFLTKSDDLVRAEMQLERQRAERLLREQLEHKRIDARHKPSAAEAKPDFDIADVLARAFALVKPTVFDESRVVNENGSATDSFDENSFYSSKAPDSTPRDGDDSYKSSFPKHHLRPVDDDEPHADHLVDRRSDEMQQVDLTDSPYKVIPRPVLSGALDPRYRQEAERDRNLGADRAPPPLEEEEDDDDDEPEYSPPEPTQPTNPRNDGNAMAGEGYADHRSRINRVHATQFQDNRRFPSPIEGDVRIVRSHINSPIAPQPSRVSPLAVAKGPPISQNRRNRQEYGQQRRRGGVESERTSPDVAISATQPRKKRKVQDARKAARRRAVEPSDPIIKDEPVSPPPFHDVPPLGATKNRQAAARPIYIDDEPVQDLRHAPERRGEAAPRPIVYDVADQTPHSVPRLLSRSGLQDVLKENRELRRVVSLQQLPAREYVEPAYAPPTRPSRAPSTVGGGPTRYQDDRPFERQQQGFERPQISEEAPPSSITYRDREPDHHYTMQPMAPPAQRRIVVDEYGQRFYETIQTPRTPAAPHPARRLEIDSYNESASVRNGTVRAASVFEEPFGEARYASDMPPPQKVYRRVNEPARPVTSDVRYFAESPHAPPADVRFVTREPIEVRAPPRSGSVQIYDYPTRQTTYVNDDMAPRESIMRVSSGRPAARSYEEPKEFYQQEQSVRQGTQAQAHDMRIFPEDRIQSSREPVQVERPTYEVRQSTEGDRYYRIDDRGRMVLDGAVDARPVYAPRY